ncbi:mitogen-activated protein kinase kinase kinase [Thecaphora frezii]
MPFELVSATVSMESAGILAEDRPWQPHSSTDIYTKSATPADASPSYFDPISMEDAYQQASRQAAAIYTHEEDPSSPSGVHAQGQAARSPSHSPLRTAAPSTRSVYGHPGSHEQPPSPSYFAGVAMLPTTKQPTITFTGAPAEVGILAPASPASYVGSQHEVQSPSSAQSMLGHAGHGLPAVSASPSSPRVPISPAESPAAMSPGGSVRPKPSSSQIGFFASFRPSSPKVLPQSRDEAGSDRRRDKTERDGHAPRSSLSTGFGSETEQKSRRPSSVLEHVGNVWERFGRKVHHARNATSELGVGAPLQPKRTSGTLGASNPVSDMLERAEDRPSPTGSNLSGSQASPLQTASVIELRRRGSASSAAEQRLPAWLEDSLAGAASSVQATSPTSNSFTHRDFDSRSPAPSVGSGSARLRGASVSAGNLTMSGRSAASGANSNPASPAHEPMEYIASSDAAGPPVRGILRQHSGGSSSIDEGLSHGVLRLHRQSFLDRVLIQVTEDNERFSVVDVSGVSSADAIKERMFAKLHLFDEDYSNFQLFRTEIGQTDVTGPVVNDDALLALCLQMGDDRGTLKFLVQQTSPPTKPAGRAVLPPLTTSSPGRALRELPSSMEGTPVHMRTESQSSRSSISDALVHAEFVTTESGGAEASPHRYSGSGLQRSKAQTRRALPNAPANEEIRSPVHAGPGSSGGYDRSSTASSTDDLERSSRPDRADVFVHNRRPAASEASSSHFQATQDEQPSRMRSFSPPLQSPHSQQQISVHLRSVHREADKEQRSHSANRQPDASGSGSTGSHSHPQQRSSYTAEGATPSGPTHRLGDLSSLPRSLQAAGRKPENYAPGYNPGQAEPVHYSHARLRSEGEDSALRNRNSSQLTIHSAKSMDDLRKRPAPPPPPMPLNLSIPSLNSFDRDGRYPNPSTARPSSAQEAPLVQRQFSSDAHVGRLGSPAFQPDPRALQRNRSAQAAFAMSGPSHAGGGRIPAAPGPMRTPAMPGRDSMAYPPDPRYGRSPAIEDLRFASQRMPQQPHHPHFRAASAHPGNAGSPVYGHPAHTFQQSSHAYDPHRPHQMPPAHANEFGVRGPVNPYGLNHPHDLRVHGSGHGQGPYPPRPHTLHDASLSPHHRVGMVTSPPFRSREDPFTSLYFPASSSRQVSEFQMAAGRLEPGMTVQETMQYRAQMVNHPPPANYGPRDLRRPATSAEVHPHPQPQHKRPPMTSLSPRREQLAALPASMERKGGPHAYPQQAPMQHASMQQGASAGNAVQQRPPMRPNQPQEPNSFRDTAPSEAFGRHNASERSSSSSFGSSGSHRLGFSNSIEDSFSAPTSVRSSQSSATNVELVRKDGALDEDQARDGDLQDEDLMNVRPLPKLPRPSQPSLVETSVPAPESSRENADGVHGGLGLRDGGGTPRPSDGEDTLKANNVASLWNALGVEPSSDASDTVTSNSDSGTLRADRSQSADTSQSASTESSATVAADKHRVEAADDNRDESISRIAAGLNLNDGGTIASFASFDDDDDNEAGTWAQPLDSDPIAPRLPLVVAAETAGSEVPSSQALKTQSAPMEAPAASQAASSPRRPELRLTIEPSGKSLPHTSASDRQASQFTSPHPSSGRLSSNSHGGSNGGGVQRSYSFAKRDNEWAFRPPPEQLYENLDDFFPKHDLDKPLLEMTGTPESPGVCSPKVEASAQLLPPSAGSGNAATPLSRHKKSIRIVAQDRKRYLERAEKRVAASPGAGNNALARRRSTRLWGTKVIEMTPGQEVSTPASATPSESPSGEGGHKPVFKWVKGDLIGKGTYGRVYLALNATTGEMIAVKQVELPRTASDREDIRQKGVVAALKSEIETLKDLDHSHIVAYLGFEETASFLSIFLEYVPGGSVGSCLRKHGKFEEATIKSFLHQILEGLAYLHSKGILHRDLKADNILVDFEGICKISDFGTVRRSDDIYGNVEDMSLQGSIFWMAPEVVSLSKKGYSAKVDIWSLGCVVLEMFAGRRPWSDDEAVQAMFKIGAERRAPPIPADVTLSKKAAHFLKNCFEIDPAKRPTASRLLDHVFSVPEEGWRFQQSSLWRHLKK